MFSPTGRLLALAAVALAIGLAAGAAFLAPANGEPPSSAQTAPREGTGDGAYLVENAAAMRKMMHAMAVKPTGDVDRDFVAMMVPHHQGAIDMATAVLRHSRNPQIVRLAQEIVVTQQEEIAAMRLAVGEPLPPSAPAPTQPARPTLQSPSSR